MDTTFGVYIEDKLPKMLFQNQFLYIFLMAPQNDNLFSALEFKKILLLLFVYIICILYFLVIVN